ncbi:MAG: hypothetical protein GX021_09805 [Tissierellia bacterium]|nr:hypothetical protein [Tissierellia bacterium]
MRTRRVGTISMAIVLIGFGLLLLISQVSKISAVEIAIRFWPCILILLGGEILWFSLKSKKEKDDLIIRYDIFSIFIVMVILFVNIVLYGFMETGIMDYIKYKISEEIHYIENHR